MRDTSLFMRWEGRQIKGGGEKGTYFSGGGGKEKNAIRGGERGKNCDFKKNVSK